jgi:type I restriction enzyme S subunit
VRDYLTNYQMILRGDTPKGFIKDDFWIIPSDWEKNKMKDILEERKEYTTDQDTYPLFSLTIEKGIVEKTDRYERQYLVTKDGDNYKVVYENDFVYNPMNIRFGAVALHKLRYPVSVSAYYNTFYIKNGYNPRFIEYFLQSFRMLHFYNKYAEGSLIEKRRLHYSVLLEYSFSFPPIFEQNRIIEILSTWDKAIELKEKLIDEKKKQKTGLMQKLLTGKVRLPGFIGEWKEVKLGKVIREINDKTTENNQYQVLTSSRQGIFLQEEYFNKSVASSNNIGYKIIKKGQFTYRTMSDDGSFKFNRLMEYENGIVSPAYVVFEAIKINPVFLMNLMNDYSFNKHIQKETQGGTRLSLKYNSLKEFVIKIPSIEEQDAIANVLNTVDKVIELNQKELEEIKLQKKGLMQLLLTGIVRVYSQEN